MMSVLSLVSDKKKDGRKESLESVYSSVSRLSLLNKRKRVDSRAVMAQSIVSKAGGDRYVTQRVLSAKTHRVKALQNQLADAHYHLQELTNENKVLRAVQKKQDIALQRYENSNAELPTVLNSHNEEMRVQQTKYKQLKAQYKEAMQKLKERDMQLQQLRDEHQHLCELSKDRNLLEREKLQIQVSELSARVQQQQETISMLQRRLTLEAKNFRHQLQTEINKHKDTRHDLDLAITNADKMSTIIEMKEKLLSTAASRGVKSPSKVTLTMPSTRTVNRSKPDQSNIRHDDDRMSVEQSMMAKLCENSRSISSGLSHDEDTSSTEPRSRFTRTRTISNSTRSTRKSSKGSDDMVELAKTVQDGMAELSIFDDNIDLKNVSPDEMQKKMDIMKAELLNKIKKNEEPLSRKSSGLRRKSTEESIEEQLEHESDESDRPRSRGRRSSVSFYNDISENTLVVVSGDVSEDKPKRENSALERKLSGKPIDTYCKEIIKDIEKSSKVIDNHMKKFNNSRFESDKLVQQLQAVDKINEFVNGSSEIPDHAFEELNNNFQMLTDQMSDVAPVPRKRSISGRRSSRVESRSNLLGDASMSNQDLLNDLLGKK